MFPSLCQYFHPEFSKNSLKLQCCYPQFFIGKKSKYPYYIAARRCHNLLLVVVVVPEKGRERENHSRSKEKGRKRMAHGRRVCASKHPASACTVLRDNAFLLHSFLSSAFPLHSLRLSLLSLFLTLTFLFSILFFRPGNLQSHIDFYGLSK